MTNDMTWLFVALGGYFLLALVSSIDKILLTEKVRNPVAYAFYMGVLAMLAFVAAPFGFRPDTSPNIIFFAILSGFTFIAALVFFFTALIRGEASRVIPTVGGLTPIFVLALSSFFLNEKLATMQLAGFGFLVLGGLILSFTRSPGHEISGKNIHLAILAALAFAISAAAIKYVYDNDTFINGFLWARIGGLIFALSLIIPKNQRNAILRSPERVGVRTDALYLANIALGAIATILIQVAIALGAVSLVQALQGTQYAFLFLILAALSKKYPRILHEHLAGATLKQKIMGIVFVSGGLVLLAAT